MYGKSAMQGIEERTIQIAQQKLEQCEREGKRTIRDVPRDDSA